MNKQDIQARVLELGNRQPWNHNFQLPFGVETNPGTQTSHGKNLIKLKRLKPIFDALNLKGKSVLDTGCNEGFFSQYMSNLGAFVQGIDVDEQRIEKAKFVQSILPDSPHLSFSVIDIYSNQFLKLDKVDFCLCLGFLHRVPDPFTAVAALAQKTDLILFEWKCLKFGPHDEAFAYFSDKSIDTSDYYGTEYWLLSYLALERILKRVGFRYFYRIDDPNQRRAILVAGKNFESIFDNDDEILKRSRFRSFLSHGKRAFLTFTKIISGKLNA